ncbi:MAG TPA: hypothetical protein VHV08_08805, partial [Pirellulales bacterium]|nr:hypothetical protein [Pirellulales bacterium]
MLARLAILMVWLSTIPLPLAAQSVVRDDFEGPELSLDEVGGDAAFRFESHARIPQEAHAGRWCERVAVRGNGGTYVYVSHAVRPARVISELVTSVWVKADRPGLQLAVRVALPRSVDSRTGKPLTTLMRGTAYTQVGSWQRLEVGGIPQLLERQARVLRSQFGPQVDPHEAYVDRIFLNVYGGPGLTNAWIDDLEVSGVVPAQATGAGPEDVRGPMFPPEGPPGGSAPATGPRVPPVELVWPLLLVDGKPFFPRAIDHQGEPLARLQALGFNTVRVARSPTAELLREAAGLGLWVIAPPPPPSDLESRGGPGGGVKLGPQFDPVLVWDLGSGLATRDLAGTKRWAKLTTAADPRGRPLVCQANSDLLDFTRHANLLLATRSPLGGTLPLADYLTWLRERSQLARPGTPLWVTIQTEPAPTALAQMAAAGGGRAPAIVVQESQIRMLVRSALAGGARALCFESHARLDSDDPAARRRATILELMNLELDVIERWPAAGNFVASASSNDAHASGAVIETDRSRLLMPIFAPPNGQIVLGNPAVKSWNLTVPGVPEGNDAYELTPTSFRPLRSDRVLGGTRVLLGNMERDSLVVFTQDELVIRSLKSRLLKTAPRAVQLARQVAADELAQVDVTEQRLSELGRALTTSRAVRDKAQDDLRQSEVQLKQNNVRAAYDLARHALAACGDIERTHWERVPAGPWPLGDVWMMNFATLPEHYRFANEVAAASRGPNLLAEGRFEDLEAMRRAGWIHYQHPGELIAANVELSSRAMHEGARGLRLLAVLADLKNKIAV